MGKIIKKIYDKNKLLQNIQKAYDMLESLGEDEVLVETLVSGSAGVYIPSEFYEMMGYEAKNPQPECEYYWDEFERVLNDANSDLQEILESLGVNEQYKDCTIYIQTWDVDGSLCILMYREKK